jgi:hypothetical protein
VHYSLTVIGLVAQTASGFAFAFNQASAGRLITGALLGGLLIVPKLWEVTNRWLDEFQFVERLLENKRIERE